MKKNYLSALILFIFIISPTPSFAQTAKDALLALKKIQAKIQVGISYNDYGPACGDAKLQVNLFLDSSEAKQNFKLTEAIKNAMKHYEGALEVWGCRFGGGTLTEVLSTPTYDVVIQSILRNNPELRSLVVGNSGNLPILEARTILWREALNDTEKASRLFTLANQSSNSNKLKP
jgi:hypothetical protein